jgi:hypothetical protein
VSEPKAELRCPKCGSGDAGRDAFLSDLSFDVFRCEACGHGETFEAGEGSWLVPVPGPPPPPSPPRVEALPRVVIAPSELPPRPSVDVSSFGCERCTGEAPRAWRASSETLVRVLSEDVHEGVRVMACRCGQAFLERFTERVRFDGEGDDVTVIRTPLHLEERGWLFDLPSEFVDRAVGALSRGRRALVSEKPMTGDDAWWREG